MNFSIGETVGAYRILQELGHGGMGRVFKVEHTITRRLEAMKVLEGGRPDTPDQAARSLQEIQLQASLDHPTIAGVHNAFWVDEHLVLVMELIQGRSLRSALETERLSLETVRDYACQALTALNYAHAHGVIHRDISPANMMVSASGGLKLTDFGLAKGSTDVRLSRTGAPIGSLHYMSPEQVRGAAADARSDIYSLGAVLYELATGKKPFEGDSSFAIMANHVGTPVVAPIDIEPTLPHSLNSAILRALEKDPAQRFPSAEEFLRAVMGTPQSSPAFNPASPTAILNPRIVWAAALGAVVSLAAAGFFRSQELNWKYKESATPLAQTDRLVYEQQNSAQAPPKPIAPTHQVHRIIPLQPPSVTERSASESAAIVTRKPSPVFSTDSRAPQAESPDAALETLTPSKEDGEATIKPARNPLIRALGKLWHLGRRKKSSSEEDTGRSSEP